MALKPQARGGQLNVLRVLGKSPSDDATHHGGREAAAQAARCRRPIADRTEPVRGAGGLFRQEPINPVRPRKEPETPAEHVLASAYQVFDRYLEEGRRFAEGQSAWYQDEGMDSDVGRSAIRALAELLGVLGRIAQGRGMSGPILNVAGVPRVVARAFHPQQDPNYPQAQDDVTGRVATSESSGQWLPVDLSGTTAPASRDALTEMAAVPRVGERDTRGVPDVASHAQRDSASMTSRWGGGLVPR